MYVRIVYVYVYACVCVYVYDCICICMHTAAGLRHHGSPENDGLAPRPEVLEPLSRWPNFMAVVNGGDPNYLLTALEPQNP